MTSGRYGNRGAQSIRGLPFSAWRCAARTTWHGFVRHRGLDSAAIVTWVLATVVYALYVTNVGTYDRVRG